MKNKIKLVLISEKDKEKQELEENLNYITTSSSIMEQAFKNSKILKKKN